MSDTRRAELEALYRATSYRLELLGKLFDCRIGQSAFELKNLFPLQFQEGWMFVTAANPQSLQLTPEQNADRRARLKDYLESRDLNHLYGEAIPDVASWPVEQGFWVFDVSLDLALEVGRVFEQSAVVFALTDTPQLLWCEDLDVGNP